MPVQNSGISWAEKIAASDSSTPNYDPVPLGRHNFSIVKTELASGPKGEYIKYRASIKDGPRANALVFESAYPNAEKIGFFLEFFRSTGLEDSVLMSNPSTEAIAGFLLNRDFSAEVYVRDDARDDKNGNPYRSLRKFQPYGGVVNAPAQAQTQANTGFGTAPQPQAQAQAQATSSFGAPVPASVPTPDQAQPTAPTSDPWASNPAQTNQATPPNPFG